MNETSGCLFRSFIIWMNLSFSRIWMKYPFWKILFDAVHQSCLQLPFFDIDIVTEKADETELLKKTAVFFRKLLKSMLGNKVFLSQIF